MKHVNDLFELAITHSTEFELASAKKKYVTILVSFIEDKNLGLFHLCLNIFHSCLEKMPNFLEDSLNLIL